MIAWAATGLLLSTALAGCAHRHAEARPAAPAAVAVKDTPPADLLICPTTPIGFPEDQSATLSAPIRTAAVRVMTALGSVSSQLVRLIEWNSPGACSPPAPEPR